ncbi:conserved hypothetical protein [Leptothrix cholodnii SP-6]|uniref:Membrane-anchored protein n=1 Tax=Leptothrix cholodnii (strain ATCC 51168 / LMG 8142 / SP-6) TaxID=395495 RepID=B1Y446_LEPCP|nr:DUF3422 domain-containing protein [Leptothrix cholodnii]ACB34568.1 conserved hypothetical protein [Leptothrix cholodnii SP-6]
MHTMHPWREALHNEVHARPHERLQAPLAITHIGWVGQEVSQAREHLNELLQRRHLPQAGEDASHLSVELGQLRLRWERHTEFHTATFVKPLTDVPQGFEKVALADVPHDWLHSLPGQWLIGMHVLVLQRADLATHEDGLPQLVRSSLSDESLVCSRVMDAQADIYTDFRLHADGFARWLVVVDGMSPRRLGRAVQRVIEIETYRMMALLGLPAAREVGATLASAERDLAEVAQAIRTVDQADEPDLLRRLSEQAAMVEGLYARTHSRFSATTAYWELVQRRITELREQRLLGLQTLGEFMERRLSPGMQTCSAAARRLQSLSERISRASNLLRTRVEVAQQRSSEALLDAMNRRQEAQLLLQGAVEGLSVAAITYYGAGLVGYMAKGMKAADLPVSPDMMVAAAVPFIALAVWWGVRKLHARILASVGHGAGH